MIRLPSVLYIVILGAAVSVGAVAENWLHPYHKPFLHSMSHFTGFIVFNLVGTLAVSVPVLWLVWNTIVTRVFVAKRITLFDALRLTAAFYLVSAFQLLPGN